MGPSGPTVSECSSDAAGIPASVVVYLLFEGVMSHSFLVLISAVSGPSISAPAVT